MLNSLLSALGLQPNNLKEAGEKQAVAKVFAESVNALFTAADLNLEQMLAAGPDALKAHVAVCGAKDGELAAAIAKINELQTAVADAGTTIAALEEWDEAASGLLESIGFVPTEDAEATQEDIKAAFAAHVKKAAALELSKQGHPPVALPPPQNESARAMTKAAFDALTPGEKSRFSRAGGRLTE